MNILCVGDIYSTYGLEVFEKNIKQLKKEMKIDFIVVNGENINKNGRSINKQNYKKLCELGVNAVTMGNHTYGDKTLKDFIDDSNIIRPANMNHNVGQGYKIFNYNGTKIAVINLLGRAFMSMFALNCPFVEVDKILEEIEADIILVDFHAEATSEKVAMSHYLDGRVTALYGTHTHIPTCDEEVMENGTMYITDIGMTGSRNGVIGVEKDIILRRFLTGLPEVNQPATGKPQFNAIILDTTKKTIKRINIRD